MHVFYKRVEVLEQLLPLLRVHPRIKVVNGIIADDVHPLILGAGSGFERVCCNVTWVLRLGCDRLAPPGAIVVYLFAPDTMRKDHRHWRFRLVVASEDLQVRGLRETPLYPRRQRRPLGTLEPTLHRSIRFEAENGDP